LRRHPPTRSPHPQGPCRAARCRARIERVPSERLACLTRISGLDFPEYPQKAIEDDEQGNFLVRLRFDSPTRPPQRQIVAGPKNHALRREIEQFVQSYRLPCMSAEPMELDQIYKFMFYGGRRTVINDMPLVTYLRSAEHVPKPVHFDLDRLGCARVALRGQDAQRGAIDPR
jgi:hypothetical protein